MTLLLSPEPEPGVIPAGVEVRPADRATTRDVLIRSLPSRPQRAGIGEPAANLHVRRTGLFSREVLRLLETGPNDLADPESLVARLRERFVGLRASGLTRQTPAYLWYRNAIGDEGHVLHAPGDSTEPFPS